jgi:hypothetical protein
MIAAAQILGPAPAGGGRKRCGDMITIGIIGALVGAVLGTRFTVLILVPAIVLAAGLISASGLAGSHPLTWTALTVVLAATSLQLGYLGGLATRHFLAVARIPRPHRALRALQPTDHLPLR